MVFEGILVDILNRFIGSYVKNIDASQLNVGIFGGDVLLEKLDLKENALDDLRLPVRIFGGHLDKLRLKVPWKNLYGAPVVAEVDGLYVVVGPASAAKYDATRDAQEKKDNKDRQLKKIEEARKRSLEPKEKKNEAPGFVEKLVTQIIKNVQVTVRNIHVTYEDQVTDPTHPFSVGVTLDSLVVQSTDSNYEIGSQDSDPTSQLIYKLVHMSCLSLYWNTDASLLGSTDLPDDWADTLKARIARSGPLPDIQYLLRPISAEAKLQLTMKPGVDNDIPQALVKVVMEHIAFSLGKQQYRNLMSLIESFDRMSINQKYLKYKPRGVSVREDPGAWWRYAITAVLEDVKRRTQMWSWKHIKEHRAKCKEYTALYEKKLLSKKVSEDLKKRLEELEAGLDVVNITLCRQLAENQAERKRTAREEQKAKSGGGGWWGWTTSWVTGSSEDTEPVITKPPTEEELAEERRKLYQALGYSESGKATTYSKEYVAHKVVVDLKKVSLELSNENGSVSELQADRVGVAFMQRPASSNINVTASLGRLTMTGRGLNGGEPPTIVDTTQQTGSLLDVRFELNPLGRRADYSVKAQLKPIKIIYDAETVDAIIGMFLLPSDVQLQKLSAAASSTIEEVKTQGRAGLEHSISQKKVLELDISLHSPYVIVPENGTLTNSSTVLLVDLGSLHVTSDPLQLDSVRNATMEQLQEAFYDDFNLQLKNVQVIVGGAGDDWESARRLSSSPLHILTPTKMDLQLKKSLMDDARLPKIKVSGELPSLKLSVSDKKIKQVLKIVQSLPLPPPSLAAKPVSDKFSYEPGVESKVDTDELIHSLTPKEDEVDSVSSDEEVWYTADEGVYDENTRTYVSSCSERGKDAARQEDISATKLELAFNIPEIVINFCEHNELSQKDSPRLDLTVTSISTTVTQKTWDLGVAASVGSLTIDDHYKREGMSGGVAKEGPTCLLHTVTNRDTQFLSFSYTKADSSGPQYQTLFSSTQQSIAVGLSLVRLDLHTESLINLISISKAIAATLKSSKDAVADDLSSSSKTDLLSSSRTMLDNVAASESKAVARIPGEKDLSVGAKLSGVELILSDHHGNLLSAKIKDLESKVTIDEKSVNVSASLSDIVLLDSDPVSLHPNVMVRMDESTNVISTNVIVYKNPSKSDIKSADLSVKAEVQRVKVTVLFRFLNRIKVFATEFLNQLKLDQKTIDSAREAAAKTASRTAEALREQSSSRVQLEVTISAPVLVLPLSSLSQSAFIADLGQLEVRNKFLTAQSVCGGEEEVFLSGKGEPAILDCMNITLSRIQLGRVEDLKKKTDPAISHKIIKPLQFSGKVTRSLSRWCKAVPAVDVQANLQTLEVQFSPDDYHAVMTLIDSLRDGLSPGDTGSSIEEKLDTPESEDSESSQTSEVEGGDEGEGGSAGIRVGATVGAIKLVLHSAGVGVASISVDDLSTNVEILKDAINVQAGIADVNLYDLSSSSETLYPKVVSVAKNAKALEAKIGIYPQATKTREGYMDTSKCDISVEASVGQLRFVLLFLFVSKLTQFLKKLQLSQAAIDRARKSARESASKAVTAVQEQHASGQRIKLSVTLDAPEVLVPLHSNSAEVIVTDLGILTLSNTFHCVSGWTEGEKPPLFEIYDIQLKDLQMFRTLEREGGDVPSRSLILEPFNLTVRMSRNLSSSWYTEIPTIDLDASLGNLKMKASDVDIESLCQVVTGNLKESLPSSPTTPMPGVGPVDAVEGSEDSPDDVTPDPVSESSPEESPSAKVVKILSLKATLESVEIELFKRSVDHDQWHKGEKNSLASLVLHQFTSSVGVEGNGAMTVAVEMLNCMLDDRRLGKKGKPTRLIKKVVRGEETMAPLISVSFGRSSSGDTSVECTMESLQVLVDIVFVFLLLDYLKSSVSSLTTSVEPPAPPSNRVSVKEQTDSVATITEQTDSQPSSDSAQTPPTPAHTLKPVETAKKESEDKPTAKLSVKVVVRRPIIGLLESGEAENSRALVLGSQVDFSMEQSGGEMALSTTVSDLAIFSARVNRLQDKSTKVLEPFKEPVKVKMSSKPLETKITATVPNIVLFLSPTTVRLILHIINSLPTSDKDKVVEIGETAPLDLWEMRPVDHNSWYLNPPEEEVSKDEEGTSVDAPAPSVVEDVYEPNEKFELLVEGLLVLVEQDLPLGGHSAPVIALKMGKFESKALDLSVSNWSSQLWMKSEICVEVSYFNLGRNVWEPLLEPAVDPADEDVYSPWTLRTNVFRNVPTGSPDSRSQATSVSSRSGSTSSHRSSSTSSVPGKFGSSKQDDLPPDMSVEIVSEAPLQLTLTKSCLRLFKDLVTVYTEEELIEAVEETDSPPPETMEAAFVIKNQLGRYHHLTVRTKDSLKVHGAYSSVVKYGTSVPLHPTTETPPLKPGEYLPRETYKKRRVHIITLEVQGFKPLDVALGTSECVYYPLTVSEKTASPRKKDKDSPLFGLVVEIVQSTTQRVTEVRIRSPLQVVNNLTEAVEVYWTKDSSDHLPATPLVTLPGGSTHSLPLESTGAITGGFYLKPVYAGSTPSKEPIKWTSKDKSLDLECYSSSRSIQGSAKCKPFFMHITIDEEHYTKQPTVDTASRAHHLFTLNYPLVLHNLLPLTATVTEKTGSVDSKKLTPGSKFYFSHVSLSEEPRFSTKIKYNGKTWAGEVTLNKQSNETTTFPLRPETQMGNVDESDVDEQGTLEFRVQVQEVGSWQLMLYCPYWIVNKTGLTLEYAGKKTDVVMVHHPDSEPAIALFPYAEAKVRVVGANQQRSEWSKVFSLDAAGSEGIFQCLDKKANLEYQMGMSVVTSNIGISKVITISPLFMAFNQTRDEISFKIGGDKAGSVYTVKSKQLLTFWPPSGSDQMCLTVNNSNMSNPSEPFKFTENSSRLVRTRDKIPAVVTEVQVTGSANVITFNPYYEGVVPVKIINYMAYDVEFQQASDASHNRQVLPAGQALYYSWVIPSESAENNTINWRLLCPNKQLKMKTIPTKDEGSKFHIPRKLIPRSASDTSLVSLEGSGRSSVSDWEESTDDVDCPDWEESAVDEEETGEELYGIEETNEDQEDEGEDMTDFSVAAGLKKFGRKIKHTITHRRSSKKHGTTGYWVSFLDGLQRVILFTTSHDVWQYVMGGQRTERASTEVTLSLNAVGLSLVNDEKGLEVAYIGIPPSKPTWQTLKRWNRWKPVPLELSEKLEKVLDKSPEELRGKIIEVPDTHLKIDFTDEQSWTLVEKSSSRVPIRRSQFQGVLVQLSLSDHMTSLEAKINAVQIDNHLPFTSNPIIFYAYPPEPTIASKYEPKPFIEGSLILRKSVQSSAQQIELLQVLVQEIGLNVDLNFILAITGIFAKLSSVVSEVENMETDLALTKLPLEKSKVEQVSAAATRNYFKLLHLSPLDIHLSFYLDRDSSYKEDKNDENPTNPVFGAVLNTLTHFAVLIGRTKDAELQLGYFELEGVSVTRDALLSRIRKHYTQQAALQMYSVVLGLEVLGNPVGFIKGLKDGAIGLFYHPIQGAVLGPGEFFEGLALGGRQFFSGTLGGLSGAVGKVSGVLGDAAAKLTMDDEYQEQRRRRAGGTDSIGRSVGGAAKGAISGLTGLFTQPIKGAKKEGAWGAIKGVGKGVFGVIFRPTAGLLDVASATFNAVQKKTKAGDFEVAELRAARYIGPERIVFPYSPRRADGYALFMEIDNGRLVDTDTFFDYVELIKKPLKVLLITHKQLAVVKHNSLINRFDDDFTVPFTELTNPARVDEKRKNIVVMPVQELETFSLGFITGKKTYNKFDKTFAVLDEKIAERSVSLINQAYQEFKATGIAPSDT